MSSDDNSLQLESLLSPLSNISEEQEEDIVLASALYKEDNTKDDHAQYDHFESYQMKNEKNDNLCYSPVNDYAIYSPSIKNIKANNENTYHSQQEYMNLNHKPVISWPSSAPPQNDCNTKENFKKQRNNKRKEYLATTQKFPYKQLLTQDHEEHKSAITPSKLWQNNEYDDEDDKDRVKILEKLFIPQWQLEFMKEFYIQGSSCESSDKYLHHMEPYVEWKDKWLGKQELQSSQEERKDDSSMEEVYTTRRVDPNQQCWDNNDEYYSSYDCSVRRPWETQSRVELVVPTDVFTKEAKKLMMCMDNTDISRRKVISYEEKMKFDRKRKLHSWYGCFTRDL